MSGRPAQRGPTPAHPCDLVDPEAATSDHAVDYYRP